MAKIPVDRERARISEKKYQEKNIELLRKKARERYYKNRERQLELGKKRRQNNREYYRRKKNEYRLTTLKWVDGMKKEKGCGNCGTMENLTYHHIDPKTKVMEIADMVNAMKNKNEILEEIKKCSVLCLSCHMKHHKENGK